MIVRCEKCLKKIGERPPYGGHEGKFDTVVIWGICPECQIKYFGSQPSREEIQLNKGKV